MRLSEIIYFHRTSINEARAHLDKYTPMPRGMLGIWNYVQNNYSQEKKKRTFIHFSRKYVDKIGINPDPNYIRRSDEELRGIWCWPLDYQGAYGRRFPYVHLITVKPDTKTVLLDLEKTDERSGAKLNLDLRKQGYGIAHDPKGREHVILGTEFIEKVRSFTLERVPKKIKVWIDDGGEGEYYYPENYKTAKLQKYYTFLKKHPDLAKKLDLVVNDSKKSVSFSLDGAALTPSVIKVTELLLYSIANKKYPDKYGIATIIDTDRRNPFGVYFVSTRDASFLDILREFLPYKAYNAPSKTYNLPPYWERPPIVRYSSR